MLKILNNINNVQTWDKFADHYHILVPPHCPSKQDLEHYLVGVVGVNLYKRILMLGVTPQLRNLLRGFDGEILVADFSRKIYQGTKERVNQSVLAQEKFLWVDWLNLKSVTENNSVDLVLGDFVFMQIWPDDREKFLDSVYSVLKPGGLFLTRVKLYNDRWAGMSPLEIIRLTAGSQNYDCFPIGHLLLYSFGDKVLDLHNFSFNTNSFIPLFREAFNLSSDAREKNYISASMNYYKYIHWVRSYFPQTFFESWVSRRFTIVDSLFSSDYAESEFCPVYILKKPQNNA